MALIRQANAREIAREAVVLDLGDLSRQGHQLIALARAKADAVLKEAQAERARIVAGGAEEGRAKGHAEGLAAGTKAGRDQGIAQALKEHREKLEQLEKAWSAALEGFEKRRTESQVAEEKDVLRLAAAIAQKVTKRAIKLDGGIVVEQVRAVLGLVTRPTSMIIAINPGDRAVAEKALPGLVAQFAAVKHAELMDDPALEPGSCVARLRGAGEGEVGGGVIDASIGTQLDRIVDALLPGETITAQTNAAASTPPSGGGGGGDGGGGT